MGWFFVRSSSDTSKLWLWIPCSLGRTEAISRSPACQNGIVSSSSPLGLNTRWDAAAVLKRTSSEGKLEISTSAYPWELSNVSFNGITLSASVWRRQKKSR